MAEAGKIILPDWPKIAKILKYKKSDFDKLLKNFVENKKNIYSQVKSVKKEDRTFVNTILAIENCDENFSDTFHQLGVYAITHKNKNFRDLANNFQKELSNKVVDLEYDKDIYKAVLEYQRGNYKKEKKTLDTKYGEGSDKLFLEMLKEYQKMGFALPSNKQDKLKDIIKKTTELAIDFSKNIAEYRDYILCSVEEIQGLPENFVKTLEKVNGKYKITLEYPKINPFLRYADNRAKRKEITDKNYQKGGKENLKILTEIIKLRSLEAKLLGFKNYVDLNLENRMAKSEKIARKFTEDLIRKVRPLAEKQFLTLNNFAKNNLESYRDIRELDYYDISYVSNKLKENKYLYDSSQIKEYFELEHTLKTTFEIFGELFSFFVEEVKDKKERSVLVDKEVRIFEFKDKKTKEIISYFILDLFPREGKYGHACSSEFIVSRFKTGKRVVPINEIICNFSKPSKNFPALLSLSEVDTFFHELGHALHFMFTKAKYGAQAGYNVVFDFVETPSQMLENFLFENANLEKLARHYKTKKPLAKDLREKIIQGKNFLETYRTLGQLILTLFDLDLHAKPIKNVAKYYRDLFKKYRDLDLPKENIFPASFGHLVGGYGAGYYSYLWALVYAKDIYSVFAKAKSKRELKSIGERYRKEILEVGGSRKELDSVKKFLGREPSNQSFLKDLT